jgi:hypothetical protein
MQYDAQKFVDGWNDAHADLDLTAGFDVMQEYFGDGQTVVIYDTATSGRVIISEESGEIIVGSEVIYLDDAVNSGTVDSTTLPDDDENTVIQYVHAALNELEAIEASRR